MIKPLPGYCLISPIEDEQKSAGGVYLPESAKDKPSKGKIVELSNFVPIDHRDWIIINSEPNKDLKPGEFRLLPTVTNEYSHLKKGVTVLYKKWVNETIKNDGKEYLLVKFQDLMAIYE